jgi:hypothetical protein
MKSDGIWRLCSRIERIFGYGRFVETICAILTWATHRKALVHLASEPGRVVIVTAWMPSYLENISEVLLRLKQDGMRVAIFPEWRRSQEPQYNRELEKYAQFEIFFDQHRALPRVDASVFLSSTATKHFYFSRGSRRFFYFHSVAGLDGFPEGGMDDYSHFLCATDQQHSQLAKRFARLGLRKTLVAAGYPKFDRIVDRIKTTPPTSSRSDSSRTVLLAPSYASEDVYRDVSMLPWLDDVIETLLGAGYRVIFRPHPVSLRRGSFVDMIHRTRVRYAGIGHFEFDETQDYFETYRRADAMLTDVSGTAMIFRLAFGKQVVFLTPEPDKAIAAFSAIPLLGRVTRSVTHLTSLLDGPYQGSDVQSVPEIFNRGNSVNAFHAVLKGNT